MGRTPSRSSFTRKEMWMIVTQRTRIDCVSEANHNLSGVERARIAFLEVALYKKISFTARGWERISSSLPFPPPGFSDLIQNP
jgi:hypothetical protein